MKRVRERDLEDDGQRKVMVKGNKIPAKLDTNGITANKPGTAEAMTAALQGAAVARTAAEARASKLETELAEAQAAIEDLSASLGGDSETKELVEAVEQELNDAIEEARLQRVRADANLAELEGMRHEAILANETLAKVRSLRTEDKAERDATAIEVSDLKTERDAARADVAKLRDAGDDEELQTLADELEEELAEARKQLTTQTAQVASQKSDLDALGEDVRLASASLKAEQAKVKQLDADVVDAAAKVAAAESHARDLSTENAQLVDKSADAAAALEEREMLLTENADQQARIKELEATPAPTATGLVLITDVAKLLRNADGVVAQCNVKTTPFSLPMTFDAYRQFRRLKPETEGTE